MIFYSSIYAIGCLLTGIFAGAAFDIDDDNATAWIFFVLLWPVMMPLAIAFGIGKAIRNHRKAGK